MNVATKVTGIGAYVPNNKIDNDYVISLLTKKSKPYISKDSFEEFIKKTRYKLERVGSNTRYWCNEDEYCTDIAYHAAQMALDDAHVEPEQIDLIIFTGMSKALVEPATAHILSNALGTVNANVLDTQDACTSFMKSMQLADALIKTHQYKKILIVTGERSFDWADFTCKTVDEIKWKFASLTIGDAAGALLLEPTDEPEYTENTKHFKFFYKVYSAFVTNCTIGLNHTIGERYRLFSHSTNLIKNGYAATYNLVHEVFSKDEWVDYLYDRLICHNVGNVVDAYIKEILESANKYIEGRYIPFFPKYGNVASATLPLEMFLAKQENRLNRGDSIMFIVPAAGVQCGIMFFQY